jgi:hypothetical protein
VRSNQTSSDPREVGNEMLRVLRVTSVATALITALILLSGGHPPEFLVPDLIVVVLLLAAAAVPRPGSATVALLGGFAFATAVFTVAAAASVVDDEVNLRVMAAAAICAVAGMAATRLLHRELSLTRQLTG